jgi:hypothetical protein
MRDRIERQPAFHLKERLLARLRFERIICLGAARVLGVFFNAAPRPFAKLAERGGPERERACFKALDRGRRVLLGNLFDDFEDSRDHLRPVYDLRVESYTPRQVEDYIAMMDAEPGWEEVLEGSGAESALVPADAPIRAALTEKARWTEVGADAGLVLLRASK